MTDATRRRLLEWSLFGAGVTVVSALAPLTAQAAPGAGRVAYPQGVASGDPGPDSVVLWTRIAPQAPTEADIEATLEVARDPGFQDLVVRTPVVARFDADHTVRAAVTDLQADTIYFYRFVVGQDVSQPLGRTRTAPSPDAERSVRLCSASCQNYEQGRFSAWRILVEEDEAAAPDEQIDFVLHLGDFIYEAIGYGAARSVPAFPSQGGVLDGGARRYAVTLEDYRHLYKTYLSDPDLIAARARFPFVCIWDDHEFSNDNWQSHSTYGTGGEPAQGRKLASNRAWSEYVPARLSDADDAVGAGNAASDFRNAEVRDVAFRHAPLEASQPEPNNLAAIESLTIYRALRWGRMLDLLLTDSRSYRSEPAVPDDLALRISGIAKGLLPVDLVVALDAGRTANDGQPAPITLADGTVIDNPRADTPAGTMLGEAQRRWFLDALSRSDARWRIWANSAPLSPMRFDFETVGQPGPVVLTIDAWDGYPRERDQIFDFIRDRAIANVLSLAGDHHMHFAGQARRENYAGEAVALEFSVAGISSMPFQGMLERYVAPDHPLRPVIAFDRPIDTAAPRADAANMTMRHGVVATLAAHRAGDEAAGLAARNPRQNPHLRFIDSKANGYALFSLTAQGVSVDYVTVAGLDGDAARVERRSRLEAAPFSPGAAEPEIVVREIEGAALFPAADYPAVRRGARF